MLQGILIVVAFLVVAALMMTKKIPTLLALPLMAVVICIIAGQHSRKSGGVGFNSVPHVIEHMVDSALDGPYFCRGHFTLCPDTFL